MDVIRSGPSRPSAPPMRRVSPSPGDMQNPRDYLLLRMALDGADFQQARRELLPEAQPQQAARAPSPPPRQPPPASGSVVLEIQSLQVEAVDVAIQGEDFSARIQFVRVEAQRIVASGNPAPAPAPPGQDPLIIDLTGEGPQTTGASGARPFDLQGSGTPRPTSLASGGSAFLALDRDGNGAIDDGRELFGDQHGAVDGYEELRTFDLNRDSRIDGQDPVFQRLELWRGDGTRQSLGDAGITALSLDARPGGGTTSGGDPVLRQATAERSDGTQLATYALALRQYDLLA